MNAAAEPLDPERFLTMTAEKCYETFMKETLRAVKEMPKPWKQLTESQQDAVLAQFDYGAKQCLRQAVEIIAADERPNIKVELEQVTFKDGIKATVKMGKTGESRHQLADAVGSTVILVIADPGPFIKGEKPKPEPQQADLNLGGKIADAMTDAEKKEAEELKAARDEDGCFTALAEAGFDITAEEIAGWTIEQITEARACAAALADMEDGEEIQLPPHLIGRLINPKGQGGIPE